MKNSKDILNFPLFIECILKPKLHIMKRIVYKSLVFSAFMAMSLTTIAQGNHYFSGNTLYDPYGRFQLYFPGEPTYNYSDLNTEMGSVRMYQFIFETHDAAYMVSYVDYPADKMALQNMDDMLKNAASGFVKALELTSRMETFINYGSYKGIMFLADDGEKYTSMRDFIVNNRLYQIGILKIGQIDVQTENEFFDSFVLTR